MGATGGKLCLRNLIWSERLLDQQAIREEDCHWVGGCRGDQAEDGSGAEITLTPRKETCQNFKANLLQGRKKEQLRVVLKITLLNETQVSCCVGPE